MIDLLSETRIPLAALGREENVAPSTTWRWVLNGVRGVKLESFSVGAKRYTTREAFARFVEATSAAAAHGPMPSVAARTPRQREAAIRRAEKELAAEGI
jgi:hypothetical protein